MVRIAPEAPVAVGESFVGVGAERALAADGVDGIRPLPARVEPLRAGPSAGEQVIVPVGREDDRAVPVVIAGRVRRALDPVAGVARNDALTRNAVGGRRPGRGAAPRVRSQRAGDGRRLEVVDERLGGLRARDPAEGRRREKHEDTATPGCGSDHGIYWRAEGSLAAKHHASRQAVTRSGLTTPGACALFGSFLDRAVDPLRRRLAQNCAMNCQASE